MKDFLDGESVNSHVHLQAPSFLNAVEKKPNSGSKRGTVQHSLNDSESFI